MSNEVSSKLNLIILECFDDIFSNFERDTKALYSFLLVNRFWCKIIIPLLWKYPFSITSKGKEIKTLSSLLTEEEKLEIIKEGINLPPKDFSSMLFNYALYIREYNTSTLYQSIEGWYKEIVYNDFYFRISYTTRVKAQLKIIFKVFTKLIMKNSTNIKNLSLLSPIIQNDIPDVNIFINSQPGFKNIENFEWNISFDAPNLFFLIKSLENISHNIQDLRIYDSNRMLYNISNNDNYIDLIVSLIKAQHNLTFVSFDRFGPEFAPILKILSIHSISLTTLQLSHISNGISLAPIQQIKNLQNFSLYKCDNLNEIIFNDFTKTDFNLKSLNIGLVKENVFKSFLKLTNRNLEKISFVLNNTSNKIDVQDLFIRCPNIFDLKIMFRCKIDLLFLSILANNLTYLTHLTLHTYNHYGNEILIELSKPILPKLKFLNIRLPELNILKNYLKITISPLEKIFFIYSSKINIDYINILLEFSKKKKTLKIIGISLNSDDDNFKNFVKITKDYLRIINIFNNIFIKI
ncbi:uncharacterized protein OCT59_003159 [Rhizophagus irregularis]|uniref:F-box domain-containing protein n=1 Tax=Rhizophagus irregularis (strain DAOM 181602 / DAOM 197198 / MUCL 43194) TaxID=747089 RepID=A0A2H5T343_RHIID|nr:hypothetical protein GLOIN_2v1875036 [Rhizophagus irregularis DAOM 181602=DAOM 197198]POG72620.1 hypothetical protein GLOIN_2v1875036 [Rhizophagus irregularis DAOM 181602=DAOM 197198]UZO11599.1 hypothetical protein OCT59_003159 [Rhizophagus irregularis]|eukprot:XP_025179486.1 hypothetical protein GLOIN_2v1875036 [Rhizophagus irregularis DAOM 181602=DAOM 197198]